MRLIDISNVLWKLQKDAIEVLVSFVISVTIPDV